MVGNYIVVDSFIGGGNRSTRRKTTDLLQVTEKTLSHNVVSGTPQQYFSYIVSVSFIGGGNCSNCIDANPFMVQSVTKS
jgi:hypothetical protein